MDENIDAINTLQAARQMYIEDRRALSVAMALRYRRRRTDDARADGMRERFIGIQDTIEAIDRAIAHERLLGFVCPEIKTDTSIVPAG